MSGKTTSKWARAILLQRAEEHLRSAPLLRRAAELRLQRGYADPSWQYRDPRETVARVLRDLDRHQARIPAPDPA